MENVQVSDAFRKYIEQLRLLKKNQNFPSSQEALKALAEQMGVSAEDLLHTRQECSHYLIRGSAYMQLERWNDARIDFENALSIDPFSQNVLYQYAYFNFVHWKKTGHWQYRLLTKSNIGELLSLYPYSADGQKLNEQFQQLLIRKKRLFYLKAMIAILGIPLFATVAVLFLREAGWLPPVSTGLEGLSYNIPANFIANEHGIKLEIAAFQVQHGETVRDQKYLDYTYSGQLTIADSMVLQRYSCKLRFYDEHNKVVAEEHEWFLNARRNNDYPNTFSLYTNDRLVFNREHHWGSGRLKKTARIARVELVPYHIKIIPDTAKMKESPLLATYPQGDRFPEGLGFGLLLREDSLHIATADSLSVHYWQMSLTHTGNVPCKELSLVVSWKGHNGLIIKEETIQVVTSRNKRFMPGERIAIGWQEYFRGEASHYQRPFDSWSVGCIASVE